MQHPPIQVRTYRGDTPDQSAREFQADASFAAANGYYPTSQAWDGPVLTVTYQLQAGQYQWQNPRPGGSDSTRSSPVLGSLTLPTIALALAIGLRIVDFVVADQEAKSAGYLGVQLSAGVTIINVAIYFALFYAIGWVLRAVWRRLSS